jgi:predicted Zn-dependent peptidase
MYNMDLQQKKAARRSIDEKANHFCYNTDMFAAKPILPIAVLALVLTWACPGTIAGEDPGPVFTFFVLDNGLQVLLQEKHDLPLTGITLAVNLGIKDETDAHGGFTHLLEHMLLFGTGPVADEGAGLADFRRRGIAVNAHTDHDLMTFEVSCPAPDSDWALDGLRQAVFSPRFDTQRLESEKRVILEEMMQLSDDPQFLGRLLVMQQLFDGHPYGRSPFGDSSALGKATVDDVLAFGRRFLAPACCALSVVGDFVLADMEKRVRETWGGPGPGHHGKTDFPLAQRLEKNVNRQVELDISESHLFFGWWAPDFNHQDRLAMSLLTYILGRGLNPLFYAALGGERRLAEQLDMGFSPMGLGGMVTLHVVLQKKDISAAKNEIARFLSQLGSCKFAKEDHPPLQRPYAVDFLQSAKNQMARDSGEYAESALNLSRASARFLLLNRNPISGSYLENVEKIGAADLRRVAARYLGGKKAVVVAIVPLEKKGP